MLKRTNKIIIHPELQPKITRKPITFWADIPVVKEEPYRVPNNSPQPESVVLSN